MSNNRKQHDKIFPLMYEASELAVSDMCSGNLRFKNKYKDVLCADYELRQLWVNEDVAYESYRKNVNSSATKSVAIIELMHMVKDGRVQFFDSRKLKDFIGELNKINTKKPFFSQAEISNLDAGNPVQKAETTVKSLMYAIRHGIGGLLFRVDGRSNASAAVGLACEIANPVLIDLVASGFCVEQLNV